MSARALSKKAGLSPAYIAKVEAGNIEPSFRAFSKIVIALEMTAVEVMFLISIEAHRETVTPSS